MRIRTLVSAAALLALSAGAMAAPLETFDFTSNGYATIPSASSVLGDGQTQAQATTDITVPVASTGTTKKLLLTGTLTVTASGAAASSGATEARIYVIPPAGAPQVVTTPSAFGNFTNVATSIASPFFTPSNGNWHFRFYESWQDSAVNTPDANWTNLVVVFDDGVVPPPSPIAYDFGNVNPTSGFTGSSSAIAIAANEVKWFKFSLTGAVDTAAFTYLDLDTEGSSIDTVLGLYNSSGVVVTSDDDDGSGLLSQLTYGRATRTGVGNGLAYNGRDGTTRGIDTYYAAVIGKGATNTFGANYATTSTSSLVGNVMLNVRAGTMANPPVANYDFGTFASTSACNVTTLDSPTQPLSAWGLVWFKVTLPSIDRALNQYCEISTNGSVISGGTFTNDTIIGLFRADGTLVGTDDDDGIDAQSSFSFGALSPTRANGNGVAGNGRDGATLTAGTYYIAAQEYGGTTTPFSATFQRAISTSTPGSGTVVCHVTVGQFGSSVTGAPAAFTNLNTLTADGNFNQQTTSVPLFGVSWFKFTLGTGVDAANRTYLDIDTEGSTGVAATSLALFDNSGALKVADSADGTDSLSQISYGFQAGRAAPGNGVAYNGRDGATLAAGDYWIAVGNAAVGYSGVWGVSSCDPTTGSVKMNIRTGTAPGATPPAPTYTFAPFSAPGTCAVSTLSSPGEALAVGGVNWYKFTVPPIDNASGTYCDLTTNGSVLATGPTYPNDTMLQVFNAAGTAVGFNDEAGTESCSAVSYGATSPTRTYGGSDALAGGNGAMTAGDYYAAVFEYDDNAETNNEFFVDPGAGTVGGTTKLNITVGKVSGSPTTVNGSPSATPLTITSNGTSLAWTSGSVPVSGTGIQWFSFTAPDLTVARSYLDFDMEGTTGVTNTALAVFTAAGAVEDSDTSSGTLNLPQLSYGFTLGRPGPGGDALSYNGRNGTLTTGNTYYLAAVVEQSDAPSTFAANWSVTTPASCAATPSGTAFLRVRYGTAPPPSAPVADANLGTVSVANSPQATASMSCPVNSFRWVHFKTSGATDATTYFVDIHAYGSVLSNPTPGLVNDTEMGLYNSTGTLVASNDDFTETGSVTLRESVLSYGKTSTVRDYSPHPIGVQGQSGAVLPAGDYYVAIGAFNMDYNAEFGAVATDGVDNGSVMITVITNTAIPPCNQADIAGLGGSLGSDGILTVDDLVVFLSNFFSGNLAVADLTNLGGSGGPDSLITVDDLVYFLSKFFSPCNP